MSNYSNAAYDFDRFGGENTKEESNVVPLPVDHPDRAQNHGKLTVKTVVKWTALFTIALVMFGSVIYNQLTLNELNTDIQKVSAQLERSKSEYIQLEMAAASRMTMEEVEVYAVDVLGMQKMQNNQLIYIRTNDDDKVIAYDTGSDTIWGQVKNWLEDVFG